MKRAVAFLCLLGMVAIASCGQSDTLTYYDYTLQFRIVPMVEGEGTDAKYTQSVLHQVCDLLSDDVFIIPLAEEIFDGQDETVLRIKRCTTFSFSGEESYITANILVEENEEFATLLYDALKTEIPNFVEADTTIVTQDGCDGTSCVLVWENKNDYIKEINDKE